MTSNRKPLTPEESLAAGDEADRASVQVEQTLQVALRQARSAPQLVATGRCLWCEEIVGPGVRFCPPIEGEPIEWACIREYEASLKTRQRSAPPPLELDDVFPVEPVEQAEDEGEDPDAECLIDELEKKKAEQSPAEGEEEVVEKRKPGRPRKNADA